MLKHAFALVIGVFLSSTVLADPYRLTTGDRILVDYDLIDAPKPTQVDIDGNIRLSEIGSIPASGFTLDQVEEAITQKMSLRGFSRIPFILVELTEYAPIIVSGFVENSGQYGFVPGMDISTALALAGGIGLQETPTLNEDILAIGARRRMAAAAETIALASIDIAQFQAALTGPDAPILLTDTLRARIPREQHDTLEQRIANSARTLSETRATDVLLINSWNGDIDDFKAQITLLDQRIALKQEVIEDVIKELNDIAALHSKGLTTATRLLTQQQLLADDREELLALETAKIAARRSASLAARTRDRYIADQRSENLVSLKAARATVSAALRDYAFAAEELTALAEQSGIIAPQLQQTEIRYTLRGPRADRYAGQAITASTPLLPGDIVFVEMTAP